MPVEHDGEPDSSERLTGPNPPGPPPEVARLRRAVRASMARVRRARPPEGDDGREAQAQRRGARAASRAGSGWLKAAAERLLTSEGWQRSARPRAGRLARLSLSNQLLVALARPDARSWPASKRG